MMGMMGRDVGGAIVALGGERVGDVDRFDGFYGFCGCLWDAREIVGNLMIRYWKKGDCGRWEMLQSNRHSLLQCLA